MKNKTILTISIGIILMVSCFYLGRMNKEPQVEVNDELINSLLTDNDSLVSANNTLMGEIDSLDIEVKAKSDAFNGLMGAYGSIKKKYDVLRTEANNNTPDESVQNILTLLNDTAFDIDSIELAIINYVECEEETEILLKAIEKKTGECESLTIEVNKCKIVISNKDSIISNLETLNTFCHAENKALSKTIHKQRVRGWIKDGVIAGLIIKLVWF